MLAHWIAQLLSTSFFPKVPLTVFFSTHICFRQFAHKGRDNYWNNKGKVEKIFSQSVKGFYRSFRKRFSRKVRKYGKV